VFVEFANEELKDKFMALEEKPKWNGTELLWLTKDAYIQGKLQDIKDGKIKPKISQRDQDHQRAAKGNRGRGNRGRGRGGARGGKDRYGGKDRNGDGRRNNGIPKVGISSNGSGIPQIKTGGANGNTASASGSPSQGVKRKSEDNPEVQEPKKIKSGEPVTTA
jgi:lupus La protein